jgi:myo-inositol-1(or 4)-monophosphatase
MAIDYKQLCKEVCELAMETGDFLTQERQKIDQIVTETKGIHDYVTQFDKESEQRIVTRLKELLPESGFIAEEGTATNTGKEQYLWIVDPLDGTTNFIHGFHTTSVSIALREGNEIVLGVVYEIWAQECYYAFKGSAAFLNGDEIHVSKAPTMNDSLIATGFPFTNFSRMTQFMHYLEWTMRNTHGVRRFGSAAADLAYTACGRVDGFFEYGLKPYDVAAGAFIVQQAGGRVCDFEGGDDWLFGGTILACGPTLFPEFSSSLMTHMTNSNIFSNQRKKK